SVHMAGLGRTVATPSFSHASAVRSRRRLLAATPPPRHRAAAPTSAVAAAALATRTSTTASWKDAATSAVETSGCLRTWLVTAVLSPLNEKSYPSSSMARGKLTAVGFLPLAAFSIAGPPGYQRPRKRHTW